MIFRCKICLLAGSYWCLVGNEGMIHNNDQESSQQPPFPSIPC